MFQQRPANHLGGCGCPQCGIFEMKQKQTKPLDLFKEEAKTKHGDKYDYSEVNYVNAKTIVSIICNKHGEFKQTPDSHLRGNGCPFCVNKTEGIVREKLQQLYPTLLTQYKQDWCKKIKHLPFDFCIPELNIIIELDGPQHFIQVSNWRSHEEQFQMDIYKEKCANNNGFLVIRLIQSDVFDNTYDWLSELTEAIAKTSKNIYLCKNDEYQYFIKNQSNCL